MVIAERAGRSLFSRAAPSVAPLGVSVSRVEQADEWRGRRKDTEREGRPGGLGEGYPGGS